MELRRKRAYDTASAEDGFRVLIDRLWPRGVSKERAAIDLWAKGIAPSTELRRDWHAAPEQDFEIYYERYRQELADDDAEALQELARELAQHPLVTLVYGVNNTAHNHAVVLEDVLKKMID